MTRWLITMVLVLPSVALAQEMPMPSLDKGQKACPKGATWQVVKDRSPVPKCKLPRQMGCTLADGRRHGPWTVMNVDHACAYRSTTVSYDHGHKTGPAVQFIVTCKEATKRRKKRCKEQMIEVGKYANGKRAGQWLILDDRGRKREHYTLTRGIKHGLFSVFNSKGVRVAVGCHQEGAETWRYSWKEKKLWNSPCSTKLKVKPVGDGTSKVSSSQKTASKMVRLAQRTRNQKLKLMYLRKAVGLCPDNKRYSTLLKAAEAEAPAPPTDSPSDSAPAAGGGASGTPPSGTQPSGTQPSGQ